MLMKSKKKKKVKVEQSVDGEENMDVRVWWWRKHFNDYTCMSIAAESANLEQDDTDQSDDDSDTDDDQSTQGVRFKPAR